jgi:hypothetical protein
MSLFSTERSGDLSVVVAKACAPNAHLTIRALTSIVTCGDRATRCLIGHQGLLRLQFEAAEVAASSG